MGDPHGSGPTHSSTLQGHLDELKRLLEGSTPALDGRETHTDGDQRDRYPGLATDFAALQQKVQELTALNAELRRQEQGIAVTGGFVTSLHDGDFQRPSSSTLKATIRRSADILQM